VIGALKGIRKIKIAKIGRRTIALKEKDLRKKTQGNDVFEGLTV
jgi:hypothetical protein